MLASADDHSETPVMQRMIATPMRSVRCLLAVCALVGWAAPAVAQDYPTRTIRMVVGFTAGGPPTFRRASSPTAWAPRSESGHRGEQARAGATLARTT